MEEGAMHYLALRTHDVYIDASLVVWCILCQFWLTVCTWTY